MEEVALSMLSVEDNFRPVTDLERVFKDECVLTFENQESPEGVFVSLFTHEGFSKASAVRYFLDSNKPLFVNLGKRMLERSAEELEAEKKRVQDIFEQTGQIVLDAMNPPYEKWSRVVVFYQDPSSGSVNMVEVPEDTLALFPEVSLIVAQINDCPSQEEQDRAASFAMELTSHPDIEGLVQLGKKGDINVPAMMKNGTLKCNHPDCDITVGLWLFLEDGFIGCSRDQYGSTVPGRNHAIGHYQETGRSVAVKLGTISPEGRADVHVYTDDDEHYDPKLGEHLAHFGIDLASAVKTESSLGELEVEASMAMELDSVREKHQELPHAAGPGLTGLRNLGNTCYIASVFQVLFSLPAFQMRYFGRLVDMWNGGDPVDALVEVPLSWQGDRAVSSLECQLRRLADGLLSGKYAFQEMSNRLPVGPRLIKKVVGRDHPEFRTGAQQDALEYYQHVLQLIERADRRQEKQVSNVFTFSMEARLQSSADKRVRYSKNTHNYLALPVPVREEASSEGEPLRVTIQEIVRMAFEDDSVELRLESDGPMTPATLRSRFATFPDILVLQVRRFAFENLMPKKLDTVVDVGDGLLDLSEFRATGPQPGEELLPDEEGAGGPQVDEGIVGMLTESGFSQNAARRAAYETQNAGAAEAMEWLLTRLEDPTLEVPLEEFLAQQQSKGPSSAAEPPADLVEMLGCLGFPPQLAKLGLSKTDNDPDRAVDWLMSHPEETGEEQGSDEVVPVPEFPYSEDGSGVYRLKGFITHTGKTPGSGHYFANIRSEREGWVKFNDSRIGLYRDVPVPSGDAYIYFYERM